MSVAGHDAWTPVLQPKNGVEKQKDPMWFFQTPGEALNLFTTAGADHARMRKLTQHGFTPRAMREQEPILNSYVSIMIDRLHQELDEMGGSGTLDIVPWFNYTTFDVFGDLAFGESFGCLDNSKYHPWLKTIFDNIKLSTWVVTTHFYPLMETVLTKCAPPALMRAKDAHMRQIRDRVDHRLNLEV